MKIKVVVKPYNPKWPEIYANEYVKIKKILKDNCIDIHHIGSTSVPGLSSKSLINILAVVKSYSSIDFQSFEDLGFENNTSIKSISKNHNTNSHILNYFLSSTLNFMNFFLKIYINRTGLHLLKFKSPKIHLIILKKNNIMIEQQLLFREQLRKNYKIRKDYENLKLSLASKYPNNMKKYRKGKKKFINSIIEKAIKEKNKQ